VHARSSEIYKAIEHVKMKDRKSPINHMGIVLDSIGLFGSSTMAPDSSGSDYIGEIYETLPFLGNKILKDNKEADNKWVEAFLDITKAHKNFLKAKWVQVHQWSGSQESGFEEALKSGVSAQPIAAAPVQIQPAQN